MNNVLDGVIFMKMKTRLTREESQHLFDLGVPKEKASEVIFNPNNRDYDFVFSLTDLLNGEILPKEIEVTGDIYQLAIFINKNTAYARYMRGDCWAWTDTQISSELIDALYQLACWYYGEYLKSEKK